MRELKEEMGYDVSELVPLGRYAVDGNRGAGVAHLFLGIGARVTAQAESDDLEEMQLMRLNEAQLEEALMNGEFKLLSWANCVALGLLHWRRRTGP